MDCSHEAGAEGCNKNPRPLERGFLFLIIFAVVISGSAIYKYCNSESVEQTTTATPIQQPQQGINLSATANNALLADSDSSIHHTPARLNNSNEQTPVTIHNNQSLTDLLNS